MSAWTLTATWEWIHEGNDYLDNRRWRECTPNTCKYLDEVNSLPDPVGAKCGFIDPQGVHRVFKVLAAEPGQVTVHHKNVKGTGPVTLVCRQVSRTLVRVEHDKDTSVYCKGTMIFSSLVSGNHIFHWPFDGHEKDNWGWLTRQVEDHLGVRYGRVILFPPFCQTPDTIEEWKKHPRNRVLVENLLDVVDGEWMQERMKSYVKKRPASSPKKRPASCLK
jgi:hypothetical protein